MSQSRKARAEDQTVRTPRQKRSRERLAQILEAARALIAERGSAGLRVQDIADRADVALGTLYQYFPNKGAIVQALGEAYIEDIHQTLQERFGHPAGDLDSFLALTQTMSREYFRLYCRDPAIRDILMGTAVDKSLQDIDYLDTKRNAELLMRSVRIFLPRRHWNEGGRAIFLTIELLTAAIRVALRETPGERDRLYATAEAMLGTALRTQLQTLAEG